MKFQRATAREEIYSVPSQTKVVIVTIGQICPGTNVVLRSIVKCLEHEYGVTDIFGVKWGFRGLAQSDTKHWLKINAAMIEGIQGNGGSYLGTCRHQRFDAEKVVDQLQHQKVT